MIEPLADTVLYLNMNKTQLQPFSNNRHPVAQGTGRLLVQFEDGRQAPELGR